jgi:hypothetical protein
MNEKRGAPVVSSGKGAELMQIEPNVAAMRMVAEAIRLREPGKEPGTSFTLKGVELGGTYQGDWEVIVRPVPLG